MPGAEQPVRLTITDIDDDVTVEVPFNPNELTRRIAVNYAKKAVLGASHQPHEYLQTDNQQLQFDLFFNIETPGDAAYYEFTVDFLESLCYAQADPESIAQAAPPRVLIVWPRTMSLEVRLMAIEFTHQRFNRFGDTIQATVRTTWEEARQQRLVKSEVREFGARRPRGGT